MKVKINGDVVTIESCINYAKLKEAAPIFIKNAEGAKAYGADVNSCDGAITKVGVTFSFPNAEGNACLNVLIANPTEDPYETKDLIVKGMMDRLTALQKYEQAICDEVENAIRAREDLAAIIEIA